MKKAIKKACKGVSYPKSSSVSKRLGSPSKAKNGIVAAGVGSSSKRVGPVDPKGAYTKVQERTLGNMKKGGKLKKQAAVAIAMKAAGKKPKMAKGGSFPDLNKDGKITKKDVLIGRGVLPKTAKKGMKIKKYQVGGSIKKSPMKSAAEAAMEAKGAKKVSSKDLIFSNRNREYKLDKSDVEKFRFQKYKNSDTAKPSMKKGGKMTKKCAYGCK